MPMAPTAPDLVARPTAFLVGDHSLLLAENTTTWRWTATMDGRLLAGTFSSQAEAWEAGVREAALVDGAAKPAGK